MTIINPTDLFSKAVQSNGEGNTVADARVVSATNSFFEGVGNKLRLGLIPAGVELHDLKMELPDSDDGANLVVDIGYEFADGSGGVPDFFLDGSTGLQAGNPTDFVYNVLNRGADDVFPLLLQKDAFITLTVMTGAGASNVGGGSFYSAWRGVTYGVK
ncbi:MAG: hypothetical protein ACRD0K_31205 [Egibacteraceae bacterium]